MDANAVGVGKAAQANSTNHMSERTARATKRAAAARQRRAKNAKTKQKSHTLPITALLAVLMVAVVVGVGFLVVPRLFQHKETKVEEYPSGEAVTVVIPDGAGGTQIAQLLVEKHVLADETSFYQEVQKQNADATMKSGTYSFVTGATPSEVVRQLVTGPNAAEYTLKLAEGLTVKQTAAQVEEQLGIDKGDFTKQCKASMYVEEYPFLEGVTDDSLEGYLFGKTYDLGDTDMTAESIIRKMLAQYQTEVSSLDFEAAKATIKDTYSIDISDYGLIKLASIIEKEATTDEDRPLIASVFYNRLRRDKNFPGMSVPYPYLQSDATMMYVTGGEVTADDLQTDNPYNTYLNPDLPPTPICSPSIESIKAALEPADTDYYYFFINENVHQFSETYEEHNQAISDSLNS